MEVTTDNYKKFFSWNEFSQLSSEERESLMRFTIREIAHDKGIASNVTTYFDDMKPWQRGSCSQTLDKDRMCTGHVVRLNSDILYSDKPDSSYDIYNTIHHELTHAKQYENASSLNISNDNPEVLELRLNDEHYYNANGDKINLWGNRVVRYDTQTDYMLYRGQACESEAREAGEKALNELQESFSNMGVNDEYLPQYLQLVQDDKIVNDREMIASLGAHVREDLATEQIKHLPKNKLSKEQKEAVLAYARSKDYQTAKAVYEKDYQDLQLSDEKLMTKFESDRENSHGKVFFESDTFERKKPSVIELSKLRGANYKWNEDISKQQEFRQNFEKNTPDMRCDIDATQSFSQTMNKKSSSINNSSVERQNFNKIMEQQSRSYESDNPVVGQDLHKNGITRK